MLEILPLGSCLRLNPVLEVCKSALSRLLDLLVPGAKLDEPVVLDLEGDPMACPEAQGFPNFLGKGDLPFARHGRGRHPYSFPVSLREGKKSGGPCQ